MSIGSFSAGLSGLNANAAHLAVIGNNLANINTTGFKSSTFTFADLVSQTVASASANPAQVGLGVVPGAVSPTFSQGSIESTREATNMAIQGDGFFIVRTPEGSRYTRAGQFSFDRNGFVVNPEGHFLQGYTTLDPVTGTIVSTGTPSDIQVPPGQLQAPTPTTTFRTLTNLDSNAAVGATFTTVVDIVDSLGATHPATITYTNTAAGAWNYDITVPGADITGGAAGTPFSIGNGTLTFNATGQLATVNGAAPADVAIATPTWTNGAAANALSWDLVISPGQFALTGFSQSSTTSAITASGNAAGTVGNIAVDSSGTIQGTTGPGQTVLLGQVALARFTNPKGLAKEGGNLFSPKQSAGLPSVGVAGSGGRGSIFGAALEQSNVDMALEFTTMILAQRGYQASSRSITVADELLLETINLKR